MSVKSPTIKGKKKKKNKPSSQKYKKYKIEGEKLVRERTCPRCGPGVFLMKADNRTYCGKCHFTEFLSATNKQKS
ncbi:MAG: 30S ribosomal protein S27ae [Candidatus Nanoarchaeia archaeon]